MTKQKLYCSFCAESQDEVEVLVGGPGVNICGKCVGFCVETLTNSGHWPTANNASLLRGLMTLAAYIGPTCVSAVETAMGQPTESKEARP